MAEIAKDTFSISMANDRDRVHMALESAKDEPTRERKIAHALVALGWVDELGKTVELLAEELTEILKAV